MDFIADFIQIPNLRMIPFEDPSFLWPVGLVRRRNAALSPAGQRFCRFLQSRFCDAKRCRTLIQFAVGSTVSMGSWDGRPIRWRVADSRGKLRLLLAEDAVLERAYNDLRVDVSWKTSTLRRWLNGEFLETAFSREERMCVISGRVDNPRNPGFFTQGGAPSMDKVFILTQEEIEKYLPAQQDRALGKWWWVRMPGCNLLSAVSVCEDGSIYEIGINVNYASGGVRPAMWVLLRV